MRYLYFLCLLGVFTISGCALPRHLPTCAAQNPYEYCVQKDDTLNRLSLRFGVDKAVIKALNQLTSDELVVGQLLRLRAADNQETLPFSSSLNTSWQMPIQGGVLQAFHQTHKGIDFACLNNAPVWAVADGRVIAVRDDLAAYGKTVLLQHSNTLMTVYAHTAKIVIKEGQKVKQGQLIAYAGTSEHQRPALHFEVRVNGRAVNPMDYLPM